MSGTYIPVTDQQFEDRRKHLELLQAVINRQASASSTAKGWALTLTSAAFGVAVVRDEWHLLLLGMFAMTWFSFLDMYYLHQERRFRDLYDAVRDGQVEPFCMKVTLTPATKTRLETYMSWSVFGFYMPLILAGVLLAGIALMRS